MKKRELAIGPQSADESLHPSSVDSRKDSADVNSTTTSSRASSSSSDPSNSSSSNSSSSSPTKRRRSLRDTNRMSLPISALQRQRLNDLFFDESDDNDDSSSASSSSSTDSLHHHQHCCYSLNNLSLHQVHSSPNVYMIDNFLTAVELAFFEAQIKKGGFKRSYVDKIECSHNSNNNDNNEDKGVSGGGGQTTTATSTYDNQHRTSTFMSFQKRQNVKITAIERRASELLGVWNTDNVEPLQLVRYKEGEFFGRHHDLGDFDEEQGTVALPPRNLFSKRRLATIFCYLNDVPEGAGGETFFPHASGLSVQPKKGRAVLFCNVKTSQDGHFLLPDERTVHEGRPVVSGTKYGLNIWICEN